jgi:hypothetical protein
MVKQIRRIGMIAIWKRTLKINPKTAPGETANPHGKNICFNLPLS